MTHTTAIPHFSVKNNFQKDSTSSYSAILSDEVLRDLSVRLTGQPDYTVMFDNDGYNKGRLVVMEFNGERTYISLGETRVRSRNSSFQSFPTAYSAFISDNGPKKAICYYVIPGTTGNIQTDYFIFMYRLMKTAGVNLLNLHEHVGASIVAFNAPEDVILTKEKLRESGVGNKSTYVTKDSKGAIQVYAKTYGANKYESSLLCFALIAMTSYIELFEIEEGGLKALPRASREALEKLGHVEVKTSTDTVELEEFRQNNSLRSIRFIYNLLDRFGAKKCTLCDCEIPQIVQGAHIWPVASIKSRQEMELEVQLGHAIHGDNGIWLCENHHKLFDAGLLHVTASGAVSYSRDLDERHVDYLKKTTPHLKIDGKFLTESFLFYLTQRNLNVDISRYRAFEVPAT